MGWFSRFKKKNKTPEPKPVPLDESSLKISNLVNALPKTEPKTERKPVPLDESSLKIADYLKPKTDVAHIKKVEENRKKRIEYNKNNNKLSTSKLIPEPEIIPEHQFNSKLPKLPADNLDDDGNKDDDVSQKEKIKKNEISKKKSIAEHIVENKDDWNDNYEYKYGFNLKNSQRLNHYTKISDKFCHTCAKNKIAHIVPDTNICDVCGTSRPIILGPLTCGRYFSPNQNNGSNYNKSLLSKSILDNKKENIEASNLLSNFMFNFINNHNTFFDKLDFDLIIPVPNFKSEPQNVAAVSVSLKLSKLLNVTCNTDILIKTQSTAGRKDHKSTSERRNMANSSYDICSDAPIKNKSILLIDDVLVGGSTARKCAKLLMENGANVILIMCLGEYSAYE